MFDNWLFLVNSFSSHIQFEYVFIMIRLWNENLFIDDFQFLFYNLRLLLLLSRIIFRPEKGLQSNRFTFVILQFHFCKIMAKYNSGFCPKLYLYCCIFAAALAHIEIESDTNAHSCMHIHTYMYVCTFRQKASIEFLYIFSICFSFSFWEFFVFFVFFDFLRQSQCSGVSMKEHWGELFVGPSCSLKSAKVFLCTSNTVVLF